MIDGGGTGSLTRPLKSINVPSCGLKLQFEVAHGVSNILRHIFDGNIRKENAFVLALAKLKLGPIVSDYMLLSFCSRSFTLRKEASNLEEESINLDQLINRN